VLSLELVLIKNNWCRENPHDCSHIYKIIKNLIQTYGVSYGQCSYELIDINYCWMPLMNPYI
jgi:hypothetical protein